MVTVLECVNLHDVGASLSVDDRYYLGHQLVYLVCFCDNFEGGVFEDELLTSEKYYCRPDPPLPPTEGHAEK